MKNLFYLIFVSALVQVLSQDDTLQEEVLPQVLIQDAATSAPVEGPKITDPPIASSSEDDGTMSSINSPPSCFDQYCPPAEVGIVNFTGGSGRLTGYTAPCNKAAFLPCQIKSNQQMWTTLGVYGIAPTAGLSEEILPAECNCQASLSTSPLLLLKFCPAKTRFENSCGCHGDPHCTSFAGEPKTWAICDDRDATCLHTPANCAKTFYQGVQCQWRSGACERDPASPLPTMIMYNKTYLNYFVPTDTTVYSFSILLTLSTYGAIGEILIKDGPRTYRFASANCFNDSPYPTRNGVVRLTNMHSGVEMQISCVHASHTVRWDVDWLSDPWFLKDSPNFGGFCPTGYIPSSDVPSACFKVDRQVASYYGCPLNKDVDTCKARFCTSYASSLRYQGSVATYGQCLGFVTKDNNFLLAACGLATLASKDPWTCLADQRCRKCVDDVTDFPDEIATILARITSPPPPPTASPTAACPGNLLSRGLARQRLFKDSNGIQIDASSDGGNQWKAVFALLEDEIISCGGCDLVLPVNGSIPSNQVLLDPSMVYRVRQSQGYDSSKDQDLFQSSTGYNLTVVYTNPNFGGGAVSRPFGDLFQEGGLVCNPSVFTKCPLNYNCCIWDRFTQSGAWNDCMSKYSGGAGAYPKCQQI